MSTSSLSAYRGFLLFPAIIIAVYAALMFYQGMDIQSPIPRVTTFAMLGIMIVLEFAFHYRNRVSQRRLVARDISSTLVNTLGTIPAMTALLTPIVLFFPELFLGRSLFFGSTAQLGPFWLQLILVMLFYSLLKYLIHRLQHKVQFLWELHSYHHSVTDLRASNTYVSHPLDFAFRNVLPPVILGAVGFDPTAIVFGTGILIVTGTFSHCGAGLNAGWLNYIFVTPEIHRWHHAAEVPAGHKYSVNYGVGFVLWDRLFGTFYLPSEDGVPAQPARLGHPGGVSDEGNYLRILFLTRYLPESLRLSRR